MALTAEETTLYTARLTEAQDALHKLMIGQSARVFVDQNGERVEFTATSSARLRAYIQELKLLLGKVETTGPMTFGMM